MKIVLFLVLAVMLGSISAQYCGTCPLWQTCGSDCGCNWPNCHKNGSVPEERLDDNLTLVINALQVLSETDLGDTTMIVQTVKTIEPFLDAMIDVFSGIKLRNQHYRKLGLEF